MTDQRHSHHYERKAVTPPKDGKVDETWACTGCPDADKITIPDGGGR